MDNQRDLENLDHEQQSKNSRDTALLGDPANPHSWFRQRLDHVRNEARKDIQLKSLRPFHEK